MKAAIASLAVFFVLASAAPASTAAVPTQGVRSQLRDTRAALAQATAQLARMRSELASRKAYVPTLRAQASRLDAVLVQTEAQLRAVQARLASTPGPIAAAVEQVRREVAYAAGGLPYSQGQLVSEAAMDYVAGHVSATAYGYLEASGGGLPPFNAAGTLSSQAGICGQAAVTFATIVQRFDLESRSVNFSYADPGPTDSADGHVGVEVFYDGDWHYFDPTFGLFWTDASGNVLSIAGVRAGLGTLQKNVASFTNVFEDALLGNDAWFETDPATKVVVGTWSRS